MTSILKVSTIQTTAGSVPTAADLGLNVTGSVLQVKQAVTDATWSTTSSTLTDVTGMSVSITPSATSSKILVIVDAHIGYDVYAGVFHLLRDTTKIYAGAGGLNRCGLFTNYYEASGASQYSLLPLTANYLDSPATTSAITYKVQFASMSGSINLTVNSPHITTNGVYIIGGTSTITVMEIAG